MQRQPTQALQRAMLDLTDPGPAQVAPVRHLLERHRGRAAEAEAQLHHEPIARGQASERVLQPPAVDVCVLLELEFGRFVPN